MNRTWLIAAPAGALLALALLLTGSGSAQTAGGTPGSEMKQMTKEARLAAIRKAQVWTRTDIPAMDLKSGPQGPGAFALNAIVACDYTEAKPSGNSPKFDCAVGPGDVVKVKYGKANGEVQAEVLSTRLLWALGFAADRMYPVRVTCRGCSPDPFTMRAPVSGGEQVFDPAAIERKLGGLEMQSVNAPGWLWSELDLVDQTQGGAPKAQRDALKLLAGFIQHSDNKQQQQRLLCVPAAGAGAAACTPFMMLNDVGQTFGNANLFNRNRISSANFEGWSKTPVWTGAAGCVARLSRSLTGSLGDPRISEAGRAFLADRLGQLSDQQLQDLFGAAGIGSRSRKPGSLESSATVVEWTAAFKRKRDEIANRRCDS
jgi:hypothetical protein